MSEDLYAGFGASARSNQPQSFAYGAAAQQQSYGRGSTALGGGYPSTSSKMSGGGSDLGRLMTGHISNRTATASGSTGAGAARPITAIKAAGYVKTKPGQSFDPMEGGEHGPAPALKEKAENGPEDKARDIEISIHRLLEASAVATAKGELRAALDKAKEAVRRERRLVQHRERAQIEDQMNVDLAFATYFNLAHVFERNKMYADALKLYQLIVKNKQYANPGRMRVNIGNIHFAKGDYGEALKNYKMAMDQLPEESDMKAVKNRIMRNIGHAHLKAMQIQQAITAYERVVRDSEGDFECGLNLLVCYYALGDVSKLRASFTHLLSACSSASEESPSAAYAMEDEDDEDDARRGESKHGGASKEGDAASGGLGALDDDGADEHGIDTDGSELAPDGLKEEMRQRKMRSSECITTAAKLIAPALDHDEWAAGFDWVIELLRAHECSAIANEVELCKAEEFLARKNFDGAITLFKGFERKDNALKARAATNLSFLYFLERDYATADRYASKAMQHARYSAKALVNKGNCFFVNNELERAKEMFLEAIGVEADCVEAIFNLGLVNKRLEAYAEAMQAFDKLHTILPENPEAVYHIADLYDTLGNAVEAIKWFNILITLVPSDPGILARLGAIYDKQDDRSQAYHYHNESYRHYPANINVISWLGVWHVKEDRYEKAVEFFKRAAQIMPQEEKWQLMVASCYRRNGSVQKALQLYEKIHEQWPDNPECLRYLVQICSDFRMDATKYQMKLRELTQRDAQMSQMQQAHAPQHHQAQEDERWRRQQAEEEQEQRRRQSSVRQQQQMQQQQQPSYGGGGERGSPPRRTQQPSPGGPGDSDSDSADLDDLLG